jgi:hypothetical protein
MLKNRVELIEHDIRKLTDRCGVAYLQAIKSGVPDVGPGYFADLELIGRLKGQLEIIKDLINKGHE